MWTGSERRLIARLGPDATWPVWRTALRSRRPMRSTFASRLYRNDLPAFLPQQDLFCSAPGSGRGFGTGPSTVDLGSGGAREGVRHLGGEPALREGAVMTT